MDWFKNNRISLVSSVLLGGGAGVLFVKLTFKYFADKSIEYYKKEYQKDLQDYNLYSLKRNEIYASLYELCQKAYGILPVLNGSINHPLWNNTDKISLVYDFFENTDMVDDLQKNSIIKTLDNRFADKTKKIGTGLKGVNDMYYGYVVKGNIDNAQNLYVVTSIYLDNDIDVKINNIIINLRLLEVYTYSRFRKDFSEEDIKKEKSLRDELDRQFEELKILMKKELFGK